MKILGIIPARYGSTRFPGKPLVNIQGKPMIQHVYERARLCKQLSKLVVATDDERIERVVKEFGGNAVMTSQNHVSGTDRCVEVLQKEKEAFDAVINIQGDEPTLNPTQLDLLAFCFNDDQCQIATLAVKLKSPELLFDPSKVKVILDSHQCALYFSRSAIPHQQRPYAEWFANHPYLKHIGVYGFRSSILREIGKLPPSALEQAEGLEQLRWMEHGYKIQVKITEFEAVSVDVPADLDRVALLM